MAGGGAPPAGHGWCAARFRVRFAETDAAGIVHHSSYLPWFEEGRSELGRRSGAPYRDLEAAGVSLVVVRVEARYHGPARYDEPVAVWTRLAEVRSRRVVFEYRVVAEEGDRLLATGTTEHVPLGHREGRPVRLPEPFLSVWREAMADDGGTGTADRRGGER